MATEIHPTAVVSPGAALGHDVVIGPYSIIGGHARIGDRTRIGPHVVIDGVTTIGADNHIVGQANLGGPPQDLSHKGEPTWLEIGDGNTVREFVTINCGTVKGGGLTKIGSGCLLMACCHVAHDCELGDRVILANGVLLAGHVRVGEGANVGGAAAANQFVTIGRYAYIGGMTRVPQDVPPFMLLEGHQARVRQVNVVGLSRAGFTEPQIESIQSAFRRIYRSGQPQRQSVEALRAEPGASAEVLELCAALEQQAQGLKGRYRESLREQFTVLGRERILGSTHAVR
ncbi:MAG: acyl-ACP--UDP-N-acetylglucosamine O-acyltransferase [Planctomycetota bacterium]|nr:acyl-ACP--UDP-N-acetylglucosamine O-acyltransferase [Planctomycetota bacterium]